ncbi:MAG: ATP-binding protein, partial [Proteobacteria bacterium]|nr:ATP-binding protein [Pseudomonadota bacterium]
MAKHQLYVGRYCEPEHMRPSGGYALLEPDRLVQHAVCFGMTGSGKTGICVTLLEELAMGGVPLLVIDPKGDMSNLALAFSDHSAASFAPWIDPAEAVRRGTTTDALAEKVSQKWKNGLKQWGVDQRRIRALTERVEVTIHTPGSSAGVPVDVLGALSAPPEGFADDSEALRELVSGLVTGLLGLVDVSADPVKDPCHIVLSHIVESAWEGGEDLNLEHLILRLVDPPFEKVGVFPLEKFFPRDDRMDLAMALNGVVSSPSFAAWNKGVPLDPAALLAKRDNRTQIRVFYLAHLDDAQRIFFVSMLLNRLVAWSRRQPGSGVLRTLVYFDEVFGYLPPYPRNPATKKPVLTLMKQARAVGVGTMLVTQNPVDVDYAAMSNAGTWMIGRLQTRQDRERVIDGLAGAAGAIDRKTLHSWLERLPPRTFLVRDVKEPEPKLIHSRWAISYLRGPLTRRELEQLPRDETVQQQQTPSVSSDDMSGLTGTTPPAPKSFEYRFLDPRVVFSARLATFFESQAQPRRQDNRIVWEPAILASLHLTFDEGRDFLSNTMEHRLFFPVTNNEVTVAGEPNFEPGDFLPSAPPDCLFAELPTQIDEATELKQLQKRVVEEVYRGETTKMFRQVKLRLSSRAGEARPDFRVRVKEAVQQKIDDDVAKLKDRVQTKVDRLEDKREGLIRNLERHKS